MFWTWTENTPQPGDVIEADDRGVPGWVPTTGEIARFHGSPKTPGFPHYLDGLPMSVVSQLGYVDRGIGKRGIFSLVDDFMATGVDLTLGSGDPDGAFGPYRVHPIASGILVRNFSYASGALELACNATPEAAGNGVFLEAAGGAFSYVPGRRLWGAVRVLYYPQNYGGVDNPFTVGAAFAGLVNIGTPDSTDFAGYPTEPDPGAEGLYFLKREGEDDWSFYAVAFDGNSSTSVSIPNVVSAVGRPKPSGIAPGTWELLSFTVDSAGAITVYVDGLVAGVIPADNAVLQQMATNEAQANAGALKFRAGVSHGSISAYPDLILDHILFAQETQADAD